MGVADEGKNGDGRPDHVRQAGHLPKAGDAHLHHGGLVPLPEAEQRQRHAQLVVEVLLGPQGAEALAQHRGDHLLGGGLAHGARDPHKGDVELAAVEGRDLPQGGLGVRHPDLRDLRRPELIAQHAGGSGPGGVRDEIVSVHPLPRDGGKQAPRRQAPAVGGDVGQFLPGELPPDLAVSDIPDHCRTQMPHIV